MSLVLSLRVERSITHGANKAGNPQALVLLAASIMPVMAIVTLVPILPLLLQEYQSVPASEFLVPIALTVPALCVALFSPLAGWFVDRVGRKRVLVVALLLYAGFGALPWWLRDLHQLILARVALGVTEAVIMTAATTLIGDYFDDQRRQLWIARQMATVSLAAVVLAATGGFLGEMLGSRGPFLLYCASVPVAIAAAAILFEPDVGIQNRSAHLPRPFPLSKVLPLVVITFGVGIVFYTVLLQLGPIMGLSGSPTPVLIGIASAATNIGVAVGTVVFRRLQHRAGPMLLATGLALAATGYAGLAFSGDIWITVALAVLACIGGGIMLPNMLAWTMRSLPAEVRGRGTGAWTGAFFLGQFAAPLLATAAFPVFGGLANVLLAYAVAAASGVVIVLALSVARDPQGRSP